MFVIPKQLYFIRQLLSLFSPDNKWYFIIDNKWFFFMLVYIIHSNGWCHYDIFIHANVL